MSQICVEPPGIQTPLSRRALLRAAPLAAAGFALPGCATASRDGLRPTLLSEPCRFPVNVSADRVIRELVGLRPYRDAGFVVAAETLESKRLVHNYGHGGGGITLSWGTAKLATQLGLQGHSGPVAVLGAGVAGLTTARLVQEAGFAVTIYAEALPPETTSNIAGGQWLPSSTHDEDAVSPAWRAQNEAALSYSYRRFQIMAGDDYGVHWRTNYFEAQAPSLGRPTTSASPTKPGMRLLGPGQHPFPTDWVRHYEVMFIEPSLFLPAMMRDIQIAGGKIAVRKFASPADVASLPETLVFNCTGLGARQLFGDKALLPVRGQLVVLLPQPEVTYAVAGRFGYMFPRTDGIVLGGTFERDNWSLQPDPATTARILSAHRNMFTKLRCAG